MNAMLKTPAFYLGVCMLLLPMVGMTQLLLVAPWVLRLAFLLVVLPLLMLVVYFLRKQVVVPVNYFVLALLGMVVLAVVAATHATNTYDAWYGAIKWLGFLLLVVLAYNCVDGERDWHFLIKCMALGGMFMALVGVGQYLFGFEFYMTSTHKYSWPSATSSHKNQASTFIALTLPLAFYLAYSATSRLRLHGWSLVVALMSVFLVYGRARQALLATAGEMVFFLFVFRFIYKKRSDFKQDLRKHLSLNFIFCFFVFLALTLMPPVGEKFSLENSAWGRVMERGDLYQTNGLNLDTASSGRAKTWKNTLSMLPDSYFIGAGYLNWQVEYPKYSISSDEAYNISRTFYWRYTHNDYLQTLVEFGFLSIFFAVLLLVGLIVCFRAVLYEERNYNKSYVQLSLMVGLFGISVVMFFSFPLSMTLQSAYMSVYLGIFSAVCKSEGCFRTLTIKNPSFVAVCVALVAIGGWTGYKQSLGWHHGFKGEFVHQYIEENLYDLKKYPDVSSYRDKIYKEVMISASAVSFNPTLDIRRGGLLSYLAITETGKDKKNFYYNESLPFMSRVKQAFPYYALPYIVEEMYWRSMGDSSRRMEALHKAIELAPGDVELTKLLVDYYLEQGELDKLYSLLEEYFRRFYDSELLDVYVYVAQETHNQKSAIANMSKIDLVKRNSTYRNEKLSVERGKIKKLAEALSSQVSNM